MFSKIYYLYKSDKPEKKYMIKFTNPKTDREKTIYFGQTGFEDYTIHKDDERKARYIKRHKGMGEHWNNPTTSGFYALHLLWNKPTLSESIKDTMDKYDIKIIRKRD
jgi:hypothetical protein